MKNIAFLIIIWLRHPHRSAEMFPKCSKCSNQRRAASHPVFEVSLPGLFSLLTPPSVLLSQMLGGDTKCKEMQEEKDPT